MSTIQEAQDKAKAYAQGKKPEEVKKEEPKAPAEQRPTQVSRQIGKFTMRKAERSNAKLRVGLAGPSGAGKTYSALLLAHGIADWEKIAIIDTENGSADLYSDMGPYNVITLEKPFHPDRYVEAIEAAQEAGMEVIIVDSISHEWSGPGGCLEIQEKLGGRFQDWAKVTPLHTNFVQALLRAKCHIITTVRSKTDYAMSTEGGKGKVQKVGLKPETREGFEYEMTISFDLNVNNMAETSKDRTGLFKGTAPFVINEEAGKKLHDWAASGIDYISQINALLKLKGKTWDPVLSTFKVLSPEDLTVGQYKSVVTKLESLPDYVPPTPEEKKAAEDKKKAEDAELDAIDKGIEKQRAEQAGK